MREKCFYTAMELGAAEQPGLMLALTEGDHVLVADAATGELYDLPQRRVRAVFDDRLVMSQVLISRLYSFMNTLRMNGGGITVPNTGRKLDGYSTPTEVIEFIIGDIEAGIALTAAKP